MVLIPFYRLLLLCCCAAEQATRLEHEADEAQAAADAAEQNATTSGLPPRIVALCPLIKREAVEVKRKEKLDFGPEVDRLSVSRGHSRQSQLNSRGSTRPLTGTGSRPGSKGSAAPESRGSSRRSGRTTLTSTETDHEEHEGDLGAPVVEANAEQADASPAQAAAEEAEDAKRRASLKALIDAETAKTQAAVERAKGGAGATLAAHERDLWVAMERARIAGRDIIPDKPQNEVPLTPVPFAHRAHISGVFALNLSCAVRSKSEPVMNCTDMG